MADTITASSQIDELSDAELEATAQEELTWTDRWVPSMGCGHNDYKDQGFPAELSGRKFESRRDYLKFRLKEALRKKKGGIEVRGGDTSYDDVARIPSGDVGETDLDEIEDDEEEAEPKRIDLQITESKRITESRQYRATPHSFWVRQDPDYAYVTDDNIYLHRTEDSKGRDVCTTGTAIRREDFVEALRLATSPEFGARTQGEKGAVKITYGQAQIELRGGSYTLVFLPAGNTTRVVVQVSGFSFQFEKHDLKALYDVMSNDWDIVGGPKTEDEEEPESVPA